MKLRRFVLMAPALGLLAGSVQAIDIDPSKKNAPDMSGNHSRFDIFAGDPARIQRANAINFSDFQSSLELAQPEISLYAMKEEGLRPNLHLTFKVKDLSPKRTYTLSFPNAKRYDFIVKSSANQIVYKWSADKLFTESVGTTMINPGDTLGYSELLPVSDFYVPLTPGDYIVEATMANYPEITAKAVLKVVPGAPSGSSDSTVSSTDPTLPTAGESSKSSEVKPTAPASVVP